LTYQEENASLANAKPDLGSRRCALSSTSGTCPCSALRQRKVKKRHCMISPGYMSFLSLSPELIEEIASHLRAQDIATFVLCCRRFHAIVQGSLLLQYACRAERAGAYDPLWGLSRRPIVDRMETLRRWEASWGDLGRYLAAAPRLVIPAERDLFGPYFLCDDYLFAVDWQGHLPDSRQPALLYVDLRDALRTGQHRWKQIDYPRGSIAITQAFSIEEDDLVVSVIR
jgi:hypothetical protein